MACENIEADMSKSAKTDPAHDQIPIRAVLVRQSKIRREVRQAVENGRVDGNYFVAVEYSHVSQSVRYSVLAKRPAVYCINRLVQCNALREIPYSVSLTTNLPMVVPTKSQYSLTISKIPTLFQHYSCGVFGPVL
jgi:hypothetical protein